jgi:cytochrome c oxidase assembly protein subunit 15
LAAITFAEIERSRRPIAYWLIATAAMTLLMVVVGGVTRLTLSGLSITEWHPVDGVLPPLNDAAWAAAFEKYQQIPEYREIHLGMSLDAFKGIYFWEYLHRLLGRLTGLVGIGCALVAWPRVSAREWPRYLAVPLLVAAQGLLGWYMVESGLEARTSVSQYRLTAHLATALVLYGYCIWNAAGILTVVPARIDAAAQRLRPAAVAVLILVAITILAGGFTAGTHAGLIYNTFPLMDGRLVPAGYFGLSPWWINPLENPTAIQFDHRVLAMSTVAATGILWLLARRVAGGKLRLLANLALTLVLCQASLGIATLLFAVPVPLAAAHQTGAVLLLTAALLTLHATRPTRARADAR